MAQAVFIFGGCRSGKSSYAVERVKDSCRVTYIATSRILDGEMQQRVHRHRRSRPETWQTIEAPYRLSEAIQQAGPESEFIIVDCLTLYLSNHFHEHRSPEQLEDQERFEVWLRNDIQGLMAVIRSVAARQVLLVSNEVGAGIVPVSAGTRFFRDMCGLMNQWVARESDEVIKMEAGLANRLK
ncbi:MAG: bifunctional adenosylcobinamide kinase/adenosylcobinamide-phosphate guanylyltransferase [bacterium]